MRSPVAAIASQAAEVLQDTPKGCSTSAYALLILGQYFETHGAGVWELLDRARTSMGLQQQQAPEMSLEQRLMLAAADREQRLDRIVGLPPEPPQPPQGMAPISSP